MTRKLRDIQVSKDFDAELSRIKSQTHAEMTDARYFHEIVSLVFDSGFKGSIVEKYKTELADTLSNYDFKKVAGQNFQSLLAKSPIKNKRKVKGCLENAKEMTRVVAKYGSFEAYLRSFGDVEHDVEAYLRMQRDMRGRFAYVGPTNLHALMKYIGFDDLKDDLHV
jgi:3-methyladenine DNA glycosylase Tag